MVHIGNSWDELLKEDFKSPEYSALREFLKTEYFENTVYPDMNDIFNAFKFTDYPDVKALILGQDPYINEGQAHGLSFSVKEGIDSPPSLINIFKEMSDDLGEKEAKSGHSEYIASGSVENADGLDGKEAKGGSFESVVKQGVENADGLGGNKTRSGCLEYLAKQGVMLLNAVLTVRKGSPNSHKGKGWEFITDRVISVLNDREAPVVFILWGRNARDKKSLITNSRHLILEAAHPSPLSAYNGFFGSKPFSKTNEFLRKNGIEEIKW